MIGCLIRLAGVLAILLAASQPARADEFATLVAGLGSDSFAEKEKAIVGLGKLGDPRAIPVLQALGDDRVRTTLDNRVVVVSTAGGTARIIDAATGEEAAKYIQDRSDAPVYMSPEEFVKFCDEQKGIYHKIFEKAGILKIK